RWAKTGRQFAVVDSKGNVAAYTGPTAPAECGDKQGVHVTAQGNTLASKPVPDSMVAAFNRTTGHLAFRLLAGIEAGQGAGGGRRGMPAAGSIIVEKGGGGDHHREEVRRRVAAQRCRLETAGGRQPGSDCRAASSHREGAAAAEGRD